MRATYSRRMRFEALEPRHMLAYLPGDYNLSGVVEQTDYDVWRAEYGTVFESHADGNGDGAVDAADYVLWRKNLGRTLADVPPDAPRGIEARAVGATSIEVTWQAANHATSYAVQRRQPDTESEFTTIALGLTATSFTDNTATADTLYDYRLVAQNQHGSSVGSQQAQAVANRANLTAYRPQGLPDENNPMPGPFYDLPFPKRPVREQDEFSATLGPGIRVNTDFDPVINGISMENDLIEVKVDRLPGQGDLILQRGSGLNVYYDYAMQMPIALMDDFRTVPLQFTNDTTTVFVEWAFAGHGTEILSLLDATTFAVENSVRFHTFRSLVVVFGGRGQNPLDTDGDGSIGDPVGGLPLGNREGIFDLAQNLYDTGWNVLAFDSSDPDTENVIAPAYFEIANQWLFQGVGYPLEFGGGISIMGYSWGGGAARELIERLGNDFGHLGFITLFGVYLDAHIHGSRFPFNPETDWPDGTFHLLNIYQTNTFPRGGQIDNNDVPPGAILEDINTTTAPGFPGNLTHFSIDDNPQVQARIVLRLTQLMFR